MASIDVPLERGRFGQTSRRDLWWLQPLAVLLGLGTFIVYSTWAGMQGDHYVSAPTFRRSIRPLCSAPPDAWFGAQPAWLPGFVTAAMLILWAPGGFRVTCYYYRGAYYKAFWADPPSCAVGEPRKTYLGERYFPLIIQNIHRYFLYLALLFIVLLAHDVWKALWFRQRRDFGIGVGTLVLPVNVILLACYTFGCHSLAAPGGRSSRPDFTSSRAQENL